MIVISIEVGLLVLLMIDSDNFAFGVVETIEVEIDLVSQLRTEFED